MIKKECLINYSKTNCLGWGCFVLLLELGGAQNKTLEWLSWAYWHFLICDILIHYHREVKGESVIHLKECWMKT